MNFDQVHLCTPYIQVYGILGKNLRTIFIFETCIIDFFVVDTTSDLLSNVQYVLCLDTLGKDRSDIFFIDLCIVSKNCSNSEFFIIDCTAQSHSAY